MTVMCEIVQNETPTQPTLVVGSKVRLNQRGKKVAHDRLHDLTGVVSCILSNSAAVQFEAVHMNSGSSERLAKNGPHVPRIRPAVSVLPVEWLEVVS